MVIVVVRGNTPLVVLRKHLILKTCSIANLLNLMNSLNSAAFFHVFFFRFCSSAAVGQLNDY